MGLRREVIAIPLLGGLDTKSDRKIVQPGQLVDVQNAEFTKGGSLRKRAGYAATPAELTDGTPVDDLLGVAALADGWVGLGRTNAYVRDAGRNAWTNLGPFTPVTYTARAVANTSSEQTDPDLDSVNGVTVVAWSDSRGGVRFSAFDDASGAALLSDVSVASADASTPKVTRVGSTLWVTWHDSAADAIVARIVPTTDVQVAASGNVTLAANASATAQYDIVSGDGAAYLTYRQDAGVADEVLLAKLNPAGTVLTQVVAHAFTADAGPVVYWDDRDNRVYTAIWESALTLLRVARFDGANLTLLKSVATTLDDVDAVALSVVPDGSPTAWVTISVGATQSVEAHGWDDEMSTLSHDVTAAVVNCRLMTQPYFDGYNTVAVVANAETPSGLQGAYYLLRHDGVFVGRAVYGSGTETNTNLPHVKLLGTDQYACAVSYRKQVPVDLAAVTGASVKFTPVYEHKSIRRIDLNTAPKLTPVEIEGVLYVNGGWLWAIDGAGPPVEAQMQMFPDMTSSAYATDSGGSLEAEASYSYRWYYEWTNGRGQRVRSMALTNTVATTSSDQQFNITLPTLQFTRTHARSPVAIVGYRTVADNPVLFYRITDPDPGTAGDNGYVANPTDTTDASVSFTDNLSDASLVGREVDYMSRGEIEHVAFDGPAVLGEAGNRLWCAGGGENPDRPQCSLIRTDGAPIEGNDTLVVTEFPEDGGATVAISHMNGVPVVFKERAIYAIEGEGTLNNRDVLDAYRVKQITSDVGCVEPRSVLSSAGGLYFKAAKGVYRLGQDLMPEYIGASVEAYNTQDVTGAAIVPDTNQCVFLTSAGRALMYDYFYGRWSTYTNHTGRSLAAGRSGFAYLRNDGQLFIRDSRDALTRSYTDAGAAYPMLFRLPLHFDRSIQGAWIARKIIAIGEYRSPHELELRIFRNREAWPRQIVTWRPDQRMGLSVWGSDTVWGSATVWGGLPRSNEYSFDAKFKARKNSVVSVEIVDRPGTSPGASYEMTELALEVWYQPGLARLPKTRKI